MINFSAFDLARKKYPKEQTPFLSKLSNKMQATKPYQGLSILHNIPLTLEAVLKIEPLLLGGADVTVSCVTLLSPNEEAVAILKAANVDVQIEHRFEKEYDFYLDCCAELRNIHPPRRGIVELTQTGSELYKSSALAAPMLSVDDSPLKLLETMFGTGDGFVRALQLYTQTPIEGQRFMLFGFGKVGKGITRALRKYTHDITVVDINESSAKAVLKKNLKYIDGRDKTQILSVLPNIDCVVSATGRKDLMTQIYDFTKSDFHHAVLANMGAYDEYGDHFKTEDVLFDKKPLNFAIGDPTDIKYLDPVLYAHNLGIDLILSGDISSGYNPFPQQAAQNILDTWALLHRENFSELDIDL